MIAKLWKKIGLIILVVACLFNIVSKIVGKMPLKEELKASAEYLEEKNR